MILIALTLVIFTAPGGVEVAVNPDEVVSLRWRTLDSQNKQVRCTINLADGKALAVIESCRTVLDKLNGIGGR